MMLSALLPIVVAPNLNYAPHPNLSTELFAIFLGLGSVLTVAGLMLGKRLLDPVTILAEIDGVNSEKEKEAIALQRFVNGAVVTGLAGDLAALSAAAYYMMGGNTDRAYGLLFFWGFQYTLAMVKVNALSSALKEKFRVP